MGLVTLVDAHLHIDGVTHDIGFHRRDTTEHITVVVVLHPNGIFVLFEAFVEQFLIVNIATFHAQHAVEGCAVVNRVTHPRKVAQKVLVALVHIDIDINMFGVKLHDGVRCDVSVTIAPGIIFIDDVLLVFCILFVNEFL